MGRQKGSGAAATATAAAAASSSSDRVPPICFPRVGGEKKARMLSKPDVLVADQVILYPDVLSSQECEDIIKLFDPLSSLHKLQPSPPARKGEAQRTNSRFSYTLPDFARQLYERTGIEREVQDWQSMFPDKSLSPVGLSSNIRVYRYEPGDIFGCHYDDHSLDPHYGPSFGKSEWTLLIYLTGEEDGVEGGQTVFYKSHAVPKKKTSENTVVAPLKRGAALFHRHGKVCMLHEALPPSKGIKWVLRSDVIFGKPAAG